MAAPAARRVSPRNFLAGLSPSHFEALRALMRPVQLEDGALLCRQGDPSDRAWFVDEGAVALSVDVPGGGESEVALARAGEVLGELGLVTDARRTAHARARGSVRLFEVERADFRGLLSYFHPAALGVTHRLALLAAERIQEATRLVHALDGIGRPPHGWDVEPPPGSDEERGAPFDVRPFLPALPFFDAYGARDLDELLEVTGASLWTLPRGRVLCPTGYLPRACYVVVRGAVELRLGDSKAARRLAVLGPGSVVGELPLLLERRRLPEARVREDCVLLEISGEALRGLLEDEHRAAFKFLAGLVPRLAERLERINHVVSRLRLQRRSAGLGETLEDPGTEGVTMPRRPSVLVIDEDPSTREVVTAALRATYQRVEEAPHADAGRTRARTGRFDVILLAAPLVGEVLEAIAAEAPVIVFDGDDALDSVLSAMRAGAHDYLPRAVGAAEIAMRIEAMVDQARVLG
ncbi:MAG: cyclic nucleotide-binding domain-containing protein [Sandaracinaceae bacterium]|nr:cyclic nucleotide-binding domain-containing protein [Sandaracinaceae bacterium]